MSESNTPSATVPQASGVFVEVLRNMSGGRTLLKLDDALREAVSAAGNAGAKAKISLELTVMPNGTGAGDTPLYKVAGKVKKTVPEMPDKASNFFADDDGNLSQRNPHQTALKLEAIEGGAGGASISKADLKAAAAGSK